MENNCSSLIRKIAHTITCMQDKCLIHYGLTNQQARLIDTIYKLSKKKKVYGRKDFAKILNLKGPSVTSLLHGLEKKNLIAIKPSEIDFRRKIFLLTSDGEKLLHNLKQVFNATENQLTDRLTDEEISLFKEYLIVATENMCEE